MKFHEIFMKFMKFYQELLTCQTNGISWNSWNFMKFPGDYWTFQWFFHEIHEFHEISMIWEPHSSDFSNDLEPLLKVKVITSLVECKFFTCNWGTV